MNKDFKDSFMYMIKNRNEKIHIDMEMTPKIKESKTETKATADYLEFVKNFVKANDKQDRRQSTWPEENDLIIDSYTSSIDWSTASNYTANTKGVIYDRPSVIAIDSISTISEDKYVPERDVNVYNDEVVASALRRLNEHLASRGKEESKVSTVIEPVKSEEVAAPAIVKRRLGGDLI